MKQATPSYPKKMGWVDSFRRITDKHLLNIPWPNINPTVISMLSVAAAILFVLLNGQDYTRTGFCLLLLNLIFDWLDGLIARRHQRESRRGWITDSLADRASELVIFGIVGQPWFSLFIINTLMVFYSVRFNKTLIIPARQIFIIFYLIKMIT